jgi:hypothetical protein
MRHSRPALIWDIDEFIQDDRPVRDVGLDRLRVLKALEILFTLGYQGDADSLSWNGPMIDAYSMLNQQ